MATIKFLIKGDKNPSTVYLRLRDKTLDLTVSTSISVDPKEWNPKELENNLLDLQTLVRKARNETITTNQTMNKYWLESLVLDWKGENEKGNPDLLREQMKLYKKRLPTKVRNGKIGVSSGTLRNYQTTIERLKKFEVYKKHNYKLTEIDFTFHDEYIRYAQNTLGLSLNSIGKDIRQFKTVCLDSKDRGLKVNQNVLSRNFSAPSEKTLFTTLNTTEIRTIRDHDLGGVNYLENARDWLIIGCWTGCRVGDLMKLTRDNIESHVTGAKFIRYTQSKTGKTVNVPLHPDVENIIAKRDGFPRAISDQRLNDYIKIVCKKAKINQRIKGTRQNPKTHLKETGYFEKWELVRSHIMRRSFATNHYNKLPNKVIMAVTGHATEKMLLNYIGEVENDHIQDYLEFWTKQKQEEPIKINQKIG